HAERDRRDDDDRVVVEEAPLMRGARLGIEPRVVRKRVEALRRKPLRDALDLLARQAVDDAGFAAVRREKAAELPPRVRLRLHAVTNVRPIEAADAKL